MNEICTRGAFGSYYNYALGFYWKYHWHVLTLLLVTRDYPRDGVGLPYMKPEVYGRRPALLSVFSLLQRWGLPFVIQMVARVSSVMAFPSLFELITLVFSYSFDLLTRRDKSLAPCDILTRSPE